MLTKIKITTFNVNGIKSFEKHLKTTKNQSINDFFLQTLSSEIICLQETKTSVIGDYTSLKDYITFFSQNKSRPGYCGVATFVKKDFYVKGVTHDKEGRWIMTDHNGFKVLNVYFPFFDENSYKKDKEEKKKEVVLFYKKIEEMAEKEQNLIILGDFNAVYDYKDHYQYAKEIEKVKLRNPNIKPVKKESPSPTELPFTFFNEKDLEDFFFSVYVRKWLFLFLSKNVYYDSFRRIHPLEESKFTCWNTLLDLRRRNLGTRIDLILVSNTICTFDSTVHNEISGSDHCPVSSLVEVDFLFDKENLCKKKKNNLLHFFKKEEK